MATPRRVLVVASWLAICLCVPFDTAHADDADLQAASRYRAYLQGLDGERQKLRTGQFVARGSRSELGTWGTFETDVQITGAFDFDNHLFRFERRQDQMVFMTEGAGSAAGDVTGVDATGRAWKAEPCGGVIIQTPEYDLFRALDGPHIDRLSPGTAVGTHVKPFDVRTIGLMTWADLERGEKYDGTFDRLAARTVEVLDDVNFPRIRAVTATPSGSRVEVWLDAEQGFAPVRLVLSRKGQDGRYSEVTRSDAVWKLVNQVWVPVSYRIEERGVPGATLICALEFEWSLVNNPIERSQFAVEALSPGSNSVVIDSRSGRPILEGRPGVAGLKMVPTKPREFAVRSWLVWLNVALCGAIIVLWLLRKARATARKP